jgi:hypothetical protein
LQPCHRITQLLDLNPQRRVLSRERLNDVQQLDHHLARGHIRHGGGVDIRNLHMRGVFQMLAPLSPSG